MGHIFVSYSRKDTSTIDNIVARLEVEGFDVWLDRHDISAGFSWRGQIVEGIQTADSFALMLSPNSVASENVLKELTLAEEEDIQLVPVMLAEVEVPAEMRYHLAGVQFLDLAEDFEEGYAELIETLRRFEKDVASTRPSELQAELVIEGIDLKDFDEAKRRELLSYVAQLANTDLTKLSFASIEAGSVRVTLRMPDDAAWELKAQALNDHPTLRGLGVTQVRLTGDSKAVQLTQDKATHPSKKTKRAKPKRRFSWGRLALVGVGLAALAITLWLGAEFLPKTPVKITATPTPIITYTPLPTWTPYPSWTPLATFPPVNPGAISGFVWNDANGSYDRQANEPGFEGVYLFLYEGECDGRGRLPVNSAVTDSSGDYGMAYILPGVYCLILDESTLPPAAYGWANTTPGESYITIELGEGDKIEINFGYQVIIG